jgi:hypothetical protein
VSPFAVRIGLPWRVVVRLGSRGDLVLMQMTLVVLYGYGGLDPDARFACACLLFRREVLGRHWRWVCSRGFSIWAAMQVLFVLALVIRFLALLFALRLGAHPGCRVALGLRVCSCHGLPVRGPLRARALGGLLRGLLQ